MKFASSVGKFAVEKGSEIADLYRRRPDALGAIASIAAQGVATGFFGLPYRPEYYIGAYTISAGKAAMDAGKELGKMIERSFYSVKMIGATMSYAASAYVSAVPLFERIQPGGQPPHITTWGATIIGIGVLSFSGGRLRRSARIGYLETRFDENKFKMNAEEINEYRSVLHERLAKLLRQPEKNKDEIETVEEKIKSASVTALALKIHNESWDEERSQ